MLKKNFFTHSSTLLFVLSLLWSSVLLMIGIWWVYIMINFERFLEYTDRSRIITMLAWEGGSFLVLLILLSLTLLILYMKDQNKTKSLQAFFSSLTHELKTPLASIRLQGEVINELLKSKEDPRLEALADRLIEDTAKLETQMDKILQLSRIERGGALNLTSIPLAPLIKRLAKTWVPGQEIAINANGFFSVEADELALELIIKNLLENTRVHTQSQKIHIDIVEKGDFIHLSYLDQGQFKGDLEKLGTLFYKHNSTKGSGIGLYLSQRLLEKMNGEFSIVPIKGSLQFNLTFKKSEESRA